jgi:putative transposase
VHGISTRDVDDLVKATGCSGISRSQVSRHCEEIDERVNAVLSRPIEGAWPDLWIEPTYLKVREAGRIVSVAVIVAVGVTRMGAARCSAWLPAPRKPTPSGRPPRRCSAPPTRGAACTGSGMPLPTCRPSSAPRRWRC